MDVASSPKKYTVLPKQCIDLWVESVGIPKLGDDVSEILAEDVAYRIRESVHNAMRIMKHCKRNCLTTDDFNHGLQEGNTELIYGHSGTESPGFKSISYKDGRICYVDEKEVNLRDIALESSFPADSGEVSVKANWLVLEGHLCSSVKAKEDHKNALKDPISSYLTNVTSALIGKSNHLRKIALKDLMINTKLQVVLPHLVSFFSLQIKHHTGKDSFVLVASYILLSINALVENQSILLTPYVFQLVKIMLFIVIEAQIPASKWLIKDKAAHVLAHLCRKQNLHNQLLKSYQDNLVDNTRPLNYLYGAIVGVKILGAEAVETILYPVLREKLKIFSEKCASAESDEEIIELASLKNAFVCAASLLLKQNRSVNVLLKNGSRGGTTYAELFEELGEELLSCCCRANHEYSLNSSSKLTSLTKVNTLNLNKPLGKAMQLINKKLEKLQEDKGKVNSIDKDDINSKITIKGVVSCFKSKRRRLKAPHFAFQESEKDDCNIPCKKRKTTLSNKIINKKLKGYHLSYRHKHNRAKDLNMISNYLPIL